MRRPSPAALLALALILGAGVWHSARRPETPRIDGATIAPLPSPPAIDAIRAPVPIEPAPVVPAPLPRPSASPATDPCAPDDAGAAARRPSISELVDATTSELVARARALDPGASDALRGGLAALGSADPEPAIAILERAPDRLDRGFDHAASAALLLGVRAFAEDRRRDALRFARRASALAPRDPSGPLLEALIASRDDDRLAARDALSRAFARDPEDPAIAWALGSRLMRSERLDEAVRALDAYLASAPEDPAARRLRARTARHADAARGALARARRGVVILAPRDLEATLAERALATIDEALGEAARWTGTPRASELVVLVHRDLAAMRAATCTPAWSGAVFDGLLHTDAETLRGDPDGVRVVLRHESLHAQLHLRPGGERVALPYWLDEGMAARFSGEPERGARRSWALLARERTWIPFPSIEGAFVDIDDPGDAGLAYHQSLAMVRYLESRRGARAIAGAIAAADRGVAPDGLLREVAPELDGARLLAHLEAELATPE